MVQIAMCQRGRGQPDSVDSDHAALDYRNHSRIQASHGAAVISRLCKAIWFAAAKANFSARIDDFAKRRVIHGGARCASLARAGAAVDNPNAKWRGVKIR